MIHNQTLTLQRNYYSFGYCPEADRRSQLKCLGTKTPMPPFCIECTLSLITLPSLFENTFNTFLLYTYSLPLSLLIGVKQAPKPSGAGKDVSVDSTHPTKKTGKEQDPDSLS